VPTTVTPASVLIAMSTSQAGVLAVVVPRRVRSAGIAIGGTVWLAFAERLGVLLKVAVPVGVALIVPGVLVAARAMRRPRGWAALKSRSAHLLGVTAPVAPVWS
jgi:hypothetical protein